MPELPLEIWKDRVENEIETLERLNVLEKNSVIRSDNSIEVIINIKALGFVLKKDRDGLDLIPKKKHRVFLKITRAFPYPGGIDFSWHSDIVHDTPIVDNPTKKVKTSDRMKTMNRVIKIIMWTYTLMKKYEQNEIPLKERRNLEWRLQVAYKLLMAETAIQGKLLKYKPKRLLGQKTI